MTPAVASLRDAAPSGTVTEGDAQYVIDLVGRICREVGPGVPGTSRSHCGVPECVSGERGGDSHAAGVASPGAFAKGAQAHRRLKQSHQMGRMALRIKN